MWEILVVWLPLFRNDVSNIHENISRSARPMDALFQQLWFNPLGARVWYCTGRKHGALTKFHVVSLHHGVHSHQHMWRAVLLFPRAYREQHRLARRRLTHSRGCALTRSGCISAVSGGREGWPASKTEQTINRPNLPQGPAFGGRSPSWPLLVQLALTSPMHSSLLVSWLTSDVSSRRRIGG